MTIVHLLSNVQLCVTQWAVDCQAPLSSTISWKLLEFIYIESVMLSVLSCAIPSPFAFSLSQHQGLFQRVRSSHHVAKVLELQFQHHPGLISFRSDWFDLPAVQGLSRVYFSTTKASILWCSAFFMTQL